jgi:unspecific monooxygenase
MTPFLLITILLFLVFCIKPLLFPRTGKLPFIPFHLSLYDALRGVGKTRFYDSRLRPLTEKYGAVWYWSAGRWVILLTKPSYLTRVFRNEQIVSKAGFIKKVPWGVFARLMGENIIDAHEDEWRYIASVMKPGIQRSFNIDSLVTKSQKLARLFLENTKLNASINTGVTIDPLTHRWAVSTYCEYFLDVELNCLDNNNVRLEKLMGEMEKAVIPLAPLFTEFPVIERLWKLFPDRRRAFGFVDEMESLLVSYTDQHLKQPPLPENADKMIHALQRARVEGALSEYRYRSNLKMLFVAGTENIQFGLISAMWELAKYQNLQDAVRHEVRSSLPTPYTAKEINSLPILTSICYEVLRLYPPLSQLIGRVALDEMPLDEENFIPKGTWVGWSAYGVQTDPNVWGPRATEFDPSRWGATIEAVNDAFRLHQARGNYITFNGYTRRCLGSHFALTQFKIVLCELLRALEWTIDPSYKLQTTVVSLVHFSW